MFSIKTAPSVKSFTETAQESQRPTTFPLWINSKVKQDSFPNCCCCSHGVFFKRVAQLWKYACYVARTLPLKRSDFKSGLMPLRLPHTVTLHFILFYNMEWKKGREKGSHWEEEIDKIMKLSRTKVHKYGKRAEKLSAASVRQKGSEQRAYAWRGGKESL